MAKTDVVIESTENAVTELKPKDCWAKAPIDSRFPNLLGHICGKKEHTADTFHVCLQCGARF